MNFLDVFKALHWCCQEFHYFSKDAHSFCPGLHRFFIDLICLTCPKIFTVFTICSTVFHPFVFAFLALLKAFHLSLRFVINSLTCPRCFLDLSRCSSFWLLFIDFLAQSSSLSFPRSFIILSVIPCLCLCSRLHHFQSDFLGLFYCSLILRRFSSLHHWFPWPAPCPSLVLSHVLTHPSTYYCRLSVHCPLSSEMHPLPQHRTQHDLKHIPGCNTSKIGVVQTLYSIPVKPLSLIFHNIVKSMTSSANLPCVVCIHLQHPPRSEMLPLLHYRAVYHFHRLLSPCQSPNCCSKVRGPRNRYPTVTTLHRT